MWEKFRNFIRIRRNQIIGIVIIIAIVISIVFYQIYSSYEVTLRIDEARLVGHQMYYGELLGNVLIELVLTDINKNDAEPITVLIFAYDPYAFFEKIKPFPVTKSPFGWIRIRKRALYSGEIIYHYDLFQSYFTKSITKDDVIEIYLPETNETDASLRIIFSDKTIYQSSGDSETVKKTYDKIKGILDSGKEAVIVYSKYGDISSTIVREAGILDKTEEVEKPESK